MIFFNESPQKIAQQIEEMLTMYQNRAEAAEKYAKKTQEEIDAAAAKKNQDEIQGLRDDFKLVYGQFDYPQEKERWLEFCKKHEGCRL